MEAPENIYIDDPTGEFDDHWSIYPNSDSIEYTRTDSFIEKACEFISRRVFNCAEGSIIEDFKKYMEDKL